ncbi:MAG: LysE family translocator [Candidatus Pacebacteria bacterium]|nr:LysE family translocator [Candidatus Paceibacterota bacterium]
MKRIAVLAFAVALTGAVAPGPMLALVMSQSLAQGAFSVFFIVAGHAAIEVVFLVLLARGMTRVLGVPKVRGSLSIVGGLVLLWMGVVLLFQTVGATLQTGRGEAELAWYMLFISGVGVSLSNPYFTGWWATVGTGQVAALRLVRFRDYVAFFVGHESGDALWFSLVAIVVATGREFIRGDVYSWVLGTCAIAICLLGAIFIAMGVRCLGSPCGTAAIRRNETVSGQHATRSGEGSG